MYHRVFSFRLGLSADMKKKQLSVNVAGFGEMSILCISIILRFQTNGLFSLFDRVFRI